MEWGDSRRPSEAPYLFTAFSVSFCYGRKHFGLGQTWFTKAILPMTEIWGRAPDVPGPVTPLVKWVSVQPWEGPP